MTDLYLHPRRVYENFVSEGEVSYLVSQLSKWAHKLAFDLVSVEKWYEESDKILKEWKE